MSCQIKQDLPVGEQRAGSSRSYGQPPTGSARRREDAPQKPGAPNMINETVANATRAAHDVGLAAWLGGAMFGKFAHNPSLVKISSRTERGSVSNAAWNGYNPINALGLGTAALGWAAARVTEARNGNLSGRERTLSVAKDGLMASSVLTGVLSGVQGARLARQAPDGAVPVETGVTPAPDTPPKAAVI
jgi:hypothetical protein